jgi:hypothetical protein
LAVLLSGRRKNRHRSRFFVQPGDRVRVTGNYLETRFAVTPDWLVELDPGLGNELGKLHKIGRKKLEAAMREVDVHHASGANRHGPEILRTGQNSLIVHGAPSRQRLLIVF